jgi:hypothetical protein
MTAAPSPTLAARGARIVTLWFGGYAVAVTAFAALGGFAAIHPAFVGVAVAVVTAALTLSYVAVPAVRALAEALGPYGLAWMHVWRVPAGLAFWSWGASGDLPPPFVALAGTGDVLAGLFAAALLALPRRRSVILGFHLFGFADFAVAVSTGLWFNVTGHPLMGAIEVLPLALIPVVGVPLSGATHIAALDLLRRGRGAA